jgi:TetR/AcrR family transcriptional regulator
MEMDAREKLLTAGTRLFAEKGFAAVSIRELSQAGQVNSSLISYYFGGKEGLYAAVLAKQFAPVDSLIASVRECELSPVERIKAYAQGVLAVHTQNPYITRFLYSEFANPTPAFGVIQQEVQKIYQFMHQTIDDGIACGQFRADLNPGHAVLAIAGMMNFYFISRPLRQSFLPAESKHDAQYFADALRIYLHGVMNYGD